MQRVNSLPREEQLRFYDKYKRYRRFGLSPRQAFRASLRAIGAEANPAEVKQSEPDSLRRILDSFSM
ncbi:MAG: hypothetical protein A3J09_00870 [Candidatus Zambryskibacteria bacterium RIFCSPLOWO2_02_FULL_51_21]|nr:MAG: hypothetical protein A3J09_00870 [Candidatus Zambryskibacteria bacterium RIFCSPLOWO2_02_FULL_51_21]